MMEGMEIGCIAIAAFIMAADEALERAPNVLWRFPSWVRFLPAVLVTLAFVLWAGVQITSPRKMTEAPSSPSTSYSLNDVPSNQGIITQGQSGNNTLVTKAPDRVLDDTMKNALISNLPKNKMVQILVLAGDPERDKFADQIDAFLKSNGYGVMSPHGYFIAVGNTPRGTEIYPDNEKPNVMVIKIGVND
jgi:hypothetical protein